MYVALFCPHCEAHINEEDLLNDHDLTPEQVAQVTEEDRDLGSYYTCGWCHERTRDWKHVIRCRTEHTVRKQINHERRGRDLALMLTEMEENDGPVAALPVPVRG